MIKNRSELLASLRQVAVMPDAPIQQKDGKWQVTDRRAAWDAFGKNIFDKHLDRLLTVSVEVLREVDPQFELPPEERYAAVIHKKTLKHSRVFRTGLAETLALMGSLPGALASCSPGKPQDTAAVAVREILKDADWLLWASLNNCLPDLAEAAPAMFLDAVEKSLKQSPSPFVGVFSQESGGFAGRNYTTGLLWALEALAWSPEYLSRTTVILGDLAALDPGGNWANRPANSLVDIFLPWHAQTIADLPLRKAAAEALLREQPQIGWKLLLALIPGSMGATSGSYKPRWRPFIPTEWTDAVPQNYWEQVALYSEMAVEAAKQELPRLKDLMKRLSDLPAKSREALLEFIASEKITALPDNERQPLWETLTELIAKHRQFSDAKWAMKPEIVGKIAEVAAKLAPKSVELLTRRLFQKREWDLYDRKGSYDEQRKALAEKRQKAVAEILAAGKLPAVVEFTRAVEDPFQVGFALGNVAPDLKDTEILSVHLDSQEEPLGQFARGFVAGRYVSRGWPWLDAALAGPWTAQQKATMLLILPFDRDAWRRADAVLGADAGLYWTKVNVIPTSERGELLEAVEKLFANGRPQAALECLSRLVHDKIDFPPALAVRALLGHLRSEGPRVAMEHYDIEELIKWLQVHPPEDESDLFRVEWSYLPMLGEHHAAKPLTLLRHLATRPEFFCEVIRTCFRSEKVTAEKKEATEDEKAIAKNAYQLLHEWNLVPGADGRGGLDGAEFSKWLAEVQRHCEESGHLRIAMHMVGQVLPFTPPDPSGLWIHKTVAEALNGKDAEEIRSGYTNKLFNMRGVHSPSAGKEELALAADYHAKAAALDALSLQRIAAALREFAKSYERDAEREAKRNPFKD